LQKSNELSLKSLVGLLNSKLYDFLYWCINPERGEGLAELKAFHLYKLPIIKLSSITDKIEVLVDQILSLKKENSAADVSELEAEIDRLVYTLYDLTKEEIAIVEAAAPNPKKTKPLLKEKVLPELS